MSILTKTVNSSNLSSISYDTEKQTLTVTFKSGSTYEYYKVEQEVYQAIADERFTNQDGRPSSGSTFIKLVRNNPSYKWKKLN